MVSDPLDQANFWLAVCWLIGVLWCFFVTVMSPLDSVRDEFSLRKKDMQRMEKTYDEMIHDIDEKMRDLIEKQIDWVQNALNRKADNFRKFLEEVSERLFGLGNDDTNIKLRNDFVVLVKRWMDCFHECTYDPIFEPFFTLSDVDISTCTSVRQICNLLLQEISSEPVNLITTSLESGSSFQPGGPLAKLFTQTSTGQGALVDRTSYGAGCSWVQMCQLNRYYISERVKKDGSQFPLHIDLCCVKMWILSGRHIMYLSLFIFGFALSVYMRMFQTRICWVSTFIGQGLVITILYKFEQLDVQASIQIQDADVQMETKKIEWQQEEVTKFYGSVEKFTCLWTYRTRARLDILKAIHGILIRTSWPSLKALQDFLEVVEDGWEVQRSQIEDLEYWLSEDDSRLSEPACKCIFQQLETCATFLRSSDFEQVTAKHFKVLNFVAVRVLGCQDLPLRGFFGTSAFVQVRVGEDGDRNWQKTETIRGTQSPKWHSDGLNAEFHINLPSDDSASLKLEVRDERFLLGQSLLGGLDIHVAELVLGQWTTMVRPLQQASCGMIELEVYRATRARELIGVIPAKPPPPPTSEPTAKKKITNRETGSPNGG
eukprot:TRINITY_DN5876_c0_g2_i1.p1 TRINITY_DN5876_c0_g2~~TRINITY_DN5876_c0_g2_i1.p1  ORF type:complete len:600 (+),score=94.24 TRINITY_DN5876_c0_g2_i1:164-1963(+)